MTGPTDAQQTELDRVRGVLARSWGVHAKPTVEVDEPWQGGVLRWTCTDGQLTAAGSIGADGQDQGWHVAAPVVIHAGEDCGCLTCWFEVRAQP